MLLAGPCSRQQRPETRPRRGVCALGVLKRRLLSGLIILIYFPITGIVWNNQPFANTHGLLAHSPSELRSPGAHLMEFVSPEGLRLDGRRPKEVRQLSAEIGVLQSADGSASFEMGNTKVNMPPPPPLPCTKGLP